MWRPSPTLPVFLAGLFIPSPVVLTIKYVCDASETALGDLRGRFKWVQLPGDCATVRQVEARVPPITALIREIRYLV